MIAVDPGIAALVVAAVTAGPAYLGLRRSAKKTHQALGQPNGHGTVADMLEHLIVGQDRIERKIDEHTLNESIHRRGMEATEWWGKITTEEHLQGGSSGE